MEARDAAHSGGRRLPCGEHTPTERARLRSRTRLGATRLLLFGILLTAPAPASAQRTTGEIHGKVTDDSGSVLPGVTVTVRGPGVIGAPTVTTSELGAYRLPLLPPGTYEIEYALSGFSTVKRTGVEVTVGAVLELDTSLKIASLEETITVRGPTAGRSGRMSTTPTASARP